MASADAARKDSAPAGETNVGSRPGWRGEHPQPNLQPANFPKAGAKRSPGGQNAQLRGHWADERVHSAIAPRRPLTLAKIFDEGLQVLGIDAGAIGVDDYTASRSLALALHQEFPDLDGVAYRSRDDNGEVCFGVFDRVNASDLVADGAKRFDATPARVDELMSRYGVLLDTSAPTRADEASTNRSPADRPIQGGRDSRDADFPTIASRSAARRRPQVSAAATRKGRGFEAV